MLLIDGKLAGQADVVDRVLGDVETGRFITESCRADLSSTTTLDVVRGIESDAAARVLDGLARPGGRALCPS